MLNWIFAWWLIGIAWFVVEFTQGGGAKHLAKLTRKEAEVMPPAILPLAAFVVALMLICAIVLMAFAWPYWTWQDYRRGVLFKPGRWDE